jgi:hypothetical protein
VKACGGLSLAEAEVEAFGLADDRRYVILADSGRALTQRDLPIMATIRPALSGKGLRLDLGGLDHLEAGAFSSDCVADVWGRKNPARAASGEVNRRLSDYLGIPARLVALGAGGESSFADSKPVLVVTSASLAALNKRLAQPIGIERFRGNVVVDGAEPLAELGWKRIRARAMELEFAVACERCEVPSIDQSSGRRMGEEPLQALAVQFDNIFGVRCRVSRPGHIVVGETLAAA